MAFGAARPAAAGPQQPWRRLGPGSRTWVVVVTAVALVVMAVVGIFSVSFGVASTAFERQGFVVLAGPEYRATESSCAGTGEAAGVKEGARVVLRSADGRVSIDGRLDEGALRSGKCVLPFDFSVEVVETDVNYAVTVAGLPASPVAGAELTASSGTVLVSLAG
ncbi:hypothetical protein AXK56_14345 [Tsukamurella pulmonis]|uniref:hypothetical protein n=1 Tax=Tsukamurella pulmonis TaxID=47312 RepID=UPI00079B0F36|nr:hypothetical protein [Tsukamurella pulmonis]KXO87604.1 hypothetical protein AXK56_14345 [Tsukamurella pulmonis]